MGSMKFEVELNGKFTVDINFWASKCRSMNYEGMELSQSEKNTFRLGNDKCFVRGTLFSGVYLYREKESALILRMKWYDYVALILPFIVGMLGGLLGGLLGVACFFVCYKTCAYLRNFFLRLLVCLAIAGALFVTIVTLAAAFPVLFNLGAK